MLTGIDLQTQRTPFSGGSGTLPAGLLSVRATRLFAWTCALLGGLAGVWFALRLGWGFVLLIAVGAAAVLFYSNVFARSGLGEIFAGLGLGALPVWGAAWVQGAPPGPAALWAGIPAFIMTFDLLLLNEFPDEPADRAGGRRNLVLLLRPPGRRARLRRRRAAHARCRSWPRSRSARCRGPRSPPRCPPCCWRSRSPGAWATPAGRVPLPALGANVAWNLATNAVLAVSLAAAVVLR